VTAAAAGRAELRRGPAGLVLALSGSLDQAAAVELRREITAQLAGAAGPLVAVDAGAVERGDTAGMSLLYELAEGRLAPGAPVITGLRPELAALLAVFPTREAIEGVEAPPARGTLLEEVGAAAAAVLRDAREQLVFLGAFLEALPSALRSPRRMRWHEVSAAIEKAGVNAVPIVSLVSLLTGSIIAFEVAQPLAMFGAQAMTASILGIVVVREFGPIFTAIVLAGRSGSAFAAEIGTMKVNEELAALTTMGLEPMRFLVVQRIVAGTLLMPALTGFAMLAGVTGGLAVMLGMGFPVEAAWGQLSASVGAGDVLVGVAKSFVFGALVSGLGCLRGMQTREGPSAVGDSATRAVVAGIVMIMAADAVFAALTHVLHI
jgi:phospholipid/cholesterol/gamma-HCH transport system permease protein